MADVHAHPVTGALPVRRLANGIAGGLVGGVLFGILMQIWNIIPMVAMLVDSESTGVGWLVHLLISAFAGLVFAVLIGLLGARAAALAPAAVVGLGYGVVWWVLGGLLIMPARLGMDTFMFNKTAWQSFAGHLVYGLTLGVVFALLIRHGQHD